MGHELRIGTAKVACGSAVTQKHSFGLAAGIQTIGRAQGAFDNGCSASATDPSANLNSKHTLRRLNAQSRKQCTNRKL